MTDSPEIDSSEPGEAASREGVEARVAVLRAEVEAETSRPQKAQLHHEIGVLIERFLANDALAVKEYLTAYNLDPSFRPPLFSLVRIFERRRSFRNLVRLHEAEQKSATNEVDRASAVLDRAVLLEDHLESADEATPLWPEAVAIDPTSGAAALMLERAARRAGDRATLVDVLARRVEIVEDPTLKALLMVELARERAQDGDLDAAFALIREAAALPAARWRSLDQMERLARRHDRSLELIEALEGRAVLAGAMARGEDQGQGSGAFSVQRFADEARAANEAAALWFESSQLRLAQHADAAGAVQALDQAITLRPDDVLLHQERMLACELAGDVAGAATEARYLIDHGVSGRFAAALYFNLAESAQAEGDVERAAAELDRALAADPSSAAGAALLDDLLLDRGAHGARVARLEARAEEDEKGRVESLWRAAQIAAEQLRDFPRARALYQRAADAAEHTARRAAVLRELYAAALRHGDGEAARDTVRTLLATGSVDDEERAALERDLYELLRSVTVDPGAARAALDDALSDPAAATWAADAARLHAAREDDLALLARAHRVIADRAPEEEVKAAHLCAAARALARSGAEDEAIRVLRSAIERSPGHRYAVALLEEMLRARGEAEEVVALLREAAAAQAGARAAEMNLLLAGAAAEATGDAKLAQKTYEEAIDRDPTSIAPLLSLRRLAEQTADSALLRDVLEKLSELELSAGEPGRATFQLGEHYDLVASKPALAEAPLEAALRSPVVGLSAAAQLLLLPSREIPASARIAAAARMGDEAREATAPAILRVLAGEGLGGGANGAAQRSEEALAALAEVRPSDRWAHWALIRLHGASGRTAERALAWGALAEATDDAESESELMLHSLRARMVAEGAEAADDAFLIAQEIAATSPDTAAAGVALDETLTGGDDAESRAEALGARIAHAGREAGTHVTAALGRALGASGRSNEALATLRRVVEEDATDLASWEAMRVAAREEQAWEDVVRACDELAKNVAGDLRAQLLEEAASVLMDDLGRDDDATERLSQALAIDPSRGIAFGRLHDLLAEREDTRGLIDLVGKRISLIDDSDELVRLFYEHARLHRSEGNRAAALDALDNVLMLEGDHVGALALKVEIHVSLEQWQPAVDALRSLAGADVPMAQRRLAHIGAADFLEKHLDDSDAAIEELRKVVELGAADAGVHARIADVAKRSGRSADAAAALLDAAAASSGAARAGYERRAAEILRAEGREDEARSALRRALAESPDDLVSAEMLADLLVDPVERRDLSVAFETTVRESLAVDPTDEDALRKLRRAAAWRGETDLEYIVLGTLLALGLALPDEEETFRARHSRRTPRMTEGARLHQESIAHLRPAQARSSVAQVARAAEETVAEMDRLEPATYGVGRGALVSPKSEHPVRDEIFAIAHAFGIDAGELYVGGNDASQIAAVPGKKGKPVFIVGDGVQAPLSEARRFVVGQLAMAIHDGILPFVQRRPGEAASVLHAAAAAAEAPLPGGAARADVEELRRAIDRKMSRRAKRAIAEAAGAAAGSDVDAWAEAAASSALRAGLLFAGDLGVALAAVLPAPFSAEDVKASRMARDLVAFFISHESLALRRELGIAR